MCSMISVLQHCQGLLCLLPSAADLKGRFWTWPCFNVKVWLSVHLNSSVRLAHSSTRLSVCVSQNMPWALMIHEYTTLSSGMCLHYSPWSLGTHCCPVVRVCTTSHNTWGHTIVQWCITTPCDDEGEILRNPEADFNRKAPCQVC